MVLRTKSLQKLSSRSCWDTAPETSTTDSRDLKPRGELLSKSDHVCGGESSPSDQENQCVKSSPSVSNEVRQSNRRPCQVCDVRQLRQLKLFLSDNLAVLSKLDEEVLELMEDDDMLKWNRKTRTERRLTLLISPSKIPFKFAQRVRRWVHLGQAADDELTPSH